jgi:hypothetical protein
MVPWMGGSIPESTHDKYWESAFYNRLLVRALYRLAFDHVVGTCTAFAWALNGLPCSCRTGIARLQKTSR